MTDEPMDGDSFFAAMTARAVTFFRLPVYTHFYGKPFHVRSIRSQWNISKLAEKFQSQLLRSDGQTEACKAEQTHQRVHRLLFRMPDDSFVDFEDGELSVFASHPDAAIKLADQLFKEFAEPEREKPQFFILNSKYGEVCAEPVTIGKPFVMEESHLDLHYGSGFSDWERQFLTMLTEHATGTSIFQGPPGTGKTSFIRHLIAKTQKSHRVYIFPVDQFGNLSRPELAEFWRKQNEITPRRQSIIVIEDAESVIAFPENRQSLSSLLNISDGLYGELLKTHVVLTINCPVTRLDAALTRPGRLLGFREFKRLTGDQARRLAHAKGITLPEQADYSLAEIYNHRVDHDMADRRIGFAA